MKFASKIGSSRVFVVLSSVLGQGPAYFQFVGWALAQPLSRPRKFRKNLKIGGILFLFISSVCNAELTLRFQPKVTEKASRLGDVLIIKNTSPTVYASKAKKDLWSHIPLDSHPTPGETLTKNKLLDWMTQRLGPFTSTWKGKTQIKIQKPQRTSAKQLVEKAKSALINQLKSQHYLAIKVTPLSHLNASAYAIDEIKADVHVSFPTSKRVCVWLSNVDKTRTAVWFKVNAYANVLVSNHDIKQNILLHENAFSLKKRDISGLKSSPLITLPQSKWLKYAIHKNTVLLENQLKEPPLILQGQHVKAVTHNHNISIVIDSIALTDGYFGETIPIKNTLNQKRIIARVTAIQEAEIIS